MYGFSATFLQAKIGLHFNTLAAGTAIRCRPIMSTDIHFTRTVSAKRRYFPVNCWFVGDAVSSLGHSSASFYMEQLRISTGVMSPDSSNPPPLHSKFGLTTSLVFDTL